MVSPKMISSPKSRSPKPRSSKSHLKDLVVGNEKAKSASKSATMVEKPKSGTTVEKSASKETDAVLEQSKSTIALADPPTKPKNAKSTTAPANPPK